MAAGAGSCYHRGVRRLGAAACLSLGVLWLCAAPLHAGRLDLDVYSSGGVPPSAQPPIHYPRDRWVPGDPRDLRGEPRWVQYTSHLGYAGLGAAGLVGSVASGGVAPAVGFGIVTFVQLWQAWQLHRAPASKG